MVVLVWRGFFNLGNFHNEFSQQQGQVAAPKELEFARKTVTNRLEVKPMEENNFLRIDLEKKETRLFTLIVFRNTWSWY